MNQKRFRTAVVSVFLFLGIFGTSYTSQASIIASGHHRFNTWNPSGANPNGEYCIVCHTPHNADATVAGSPLWNHKVTTASYTLYNSATLKATMGQPDGPSKLCLSCHDGTVGTQAFGAQRDNAALLGFSATSKKNLGTNLANDHPVSFEYLPGLLADDPELNDPATSLSGVPGKSGTIDEDMLRNHKVQCITCHDIHNPAQYINPTTHLATYSKLLKKSNLGSALCLTCHKK